MGVLECWSIGTPEAPDCGIEKSRTDRLIV